MESNTINKTTKQQNHKTTKPQNQSTILFSKYVKPLTHDALQFEF